MTTDAVILVGPQGDILSINEAWGNLHENHQAPFSVFADRVRREADAGKSSLFLWLFRDDDLTGSEAYGHANAALQDFWRNGNGQDFLFVVSFGGQSAAVSVSLSQVAFKGENVAMAIFSPSIVGKTF